MITHFFFCGYQMLGIPFTVERFLLRIRKFPCKEKMQMEPGELLFMITMGLLREREMIN